MKKLSHLDEHDKLRMVDVGDKDTSVRTAIASAKILMHQETLRLILDGALPKGDVVTTAKLAGILAAKKTADLIPLCHTLPLSVVDIDMSPDISGGSMTITAFCKVAAKTGVEMEAMTAVSVAALTLYDMCKAVQKDIVISEIRLLEKTGGKSGPFTSP